MKIAGLAAKGIAALISFVLLFSSPAAVATEETSKASLLGIETLDTGQYAYRVSLQLDNRVERLLLNEYSELNQLKIIDVSGERHQQAGVAYRGIVEFLPMSRAELVIEGNFVAGTISTGGETMQIASTAAIGIQPVGRSIDRSLFPPPTPADFQRQEVDIPITTTFSDAQGQVSQVAEIGIVIDSLYDEAIAGRGVSKAISTINSVDALYREKFGLALKVNVVVLATDTATLPLNGNNLEENLNLFRDYRILSELLPADLALVHLFTGINSGDDSIGLAFSGAACRTDGYDVSMSRPFSFPVILTAHEIGHNLGASHDDETLECRDINDRLMFSQINFDTTTEFSSCSVSAITTRLQQSACYSAAINMELDITQLESNQVLATVTNLDDSRAFPAATLQFDLQNATVAEAPAICALENPSLLICSVPATFAGDSHEVAVKLRLDPDEERTLTASLEPNGFFDLDETNNFFELTIPGDPQPLPVTIGEIVTVQGTDGSSNNESGTGGSSGGGAIGQLFLTMLLLNSVCRRYRRTSNSLETSLH